MVTFPVPISSRGGGSPSEEWGLQALRGATHAGAYAAWRAVKQWHLDTKRNSETETGWACALPQLEAHDDAQGLLGW